MSVEHTGGRLPLFGGFGQLNGARACLLFSPWCHGLVFGQRQAELVVGTFDLEAFTEAAVHSPSDGRPRRRSSVRAEAGDDGPVPATPLAIALSSPVEPEVTYLLEPNVAHGVGKDRVPVADWRVWLQHRFMLAGGVVVVALTLLTPNTSACGRSMRL